MQARGHVGVGQFVGSDEMSPVSFTYILPSVKYLWGIIT
jgi:hypothetical protein